MALNIFSCAYLSFVYLLWGKLSLPVVCHFLTGLFFLLLSFESALYSLHTGLIIDMLLCKIFLPVYSLAFHLADRPFTEQTLVILVESKWWNFPFFVSCFQCQTLRIALDPVDFLRFFSRCLISYSFMFFFSFFIKNKISEPSSLLPSHTIPLGRPSAPAPSIQHRALNLDWHLISYMTKLCLKALLKLPFVPPSSVYSRMPFPLTFLMMILGYCIRTNYTRNMLNESL